MKSFVAKLGNMRKAVEWITYPARDDGLILIQSDHRMCRFDPKTGKGTLGRNATNSCCIDLVLPGATEIVVPKNIIDMAVDAQPNHGDSVCNGVVKIA